MRRAVVIVTATLEGDLSKAVSLLMSGDSPVPKPSAAHQALLAFYPQRDRLVTQQPLADHSAPLELDFEASAVVKASMSFLPGSSWGPRASGRYILWRR